jgi:chemotaxis protein MotA
MTANVIFLPIGNRLTRLSQIEAARMEMVIEGVLAVQAGANPRAVHQRLTSLLPEHERDLEAKAA